MVAAKRIRFLDLDIIVLDVQYISLLVNLHVNNNSFVIEHVQERSDLLNHIDSVGLALLMW
jgi:hypothetical protein